MERLRPKELPTQLRARLGSAGFDSNTVNNPVERLSGGQKARLLMAMATIDAPHILIFDEPTNHLDIESREALVHALNAYEGTVILVSHDSHLVETVADQLWIVQDGLVAPFDGDLADYERQLLARPAIDGATGERKKSKSMRSDAKPRSRGLEHRQNLSQLRAKVKSAEKTLGMLAIEKKQTEVEMAKPGFYGRKNSRKIADFSIKLAKIEAAIIDAEQDWLVAEEALDTAQKALLQ
jgi:ATP-binding cassette subfamily F protein 3